MTRPNPQANGNDWESQPQQQRSSVADNRRAQRSYQDPQQRSNASNNSSGSSSSSSVTSNPTSVGFIKEIVRQSPSAPSSSSLLPGISRAGQPQFKKVCGGKGNNSKNGKRVRLERKSYCAECGRDFSKGGLKRHFKLVHGPNAADRFRNVRNRAAAATAAFTRNQNNPIGCASHIYIINSTQYCRLQFCVIIFQREHRVLEVYKSCCSCCFCDFLQNV